MFFSPQSGSASNTLNRANRRKQRMFRARKLNRNYQFACISRRRKPRIHSAFIFSGITRFINHANVADQLRSITPSSADYPFAIRFTIRARSHDRGEIRDLFSIKSPYNQIAKSRRESKDFRAQDSVLFSLSHLFRPAASPLFLPLGSRPTPTSWRNAVVHPCLCARLLPPVSYPPFLFLRSRDRSYGDFPDCKLQKF